MRISDWSSDVCSSDLHAEHYNFISREEFARMIDAGDFFEHALVHGDWMGTAIKAVESRLAEGRDVLLALYCAGARPARKPVPDAVGGFLLPPPRAASVSRQSVGWGKRGEDGLITAGS